MPDLISALFRPEFAFLRLAFLAGAFASVAFGIVGSLVVARRLSALAGGLAHCCLGGIALGLFVERVLQVTWFGASVGALIVSIIAAIGLGILTLHYREREDSLIGVLWAIGMAGGLLLLDFTPGYTDLMSYLFGDILLVAPRDLYLTAALGGGLIIYALGFYRQILATCFDHEFAGLRGVRANFHYLFMLTLTAITVVITVRLTGVIMVIAMLTIPAAAAGRFCGGLRMMMFAATGLAWFFMWSGLATSYALGASYNLNVASGPMIIVIAGVAYLLIMLYSRLIEAKK